MPATIYGPNLTYQYSPLGEWATAHGANIALPLTESSPEAYKALFLESWRDSGRSPEACWDRLRELTVSLLADLPDNEYVQQNRPASEIISKRP